MKISKKIILVLFLSCLFINTNAYAVVKLDFFEPVADFAQKVQKTKSKIEEKYTETIQKLNEKVRKAVGVEGAALFQTVLNRGRYIIRRAVTGQLSRDDLSISHMLDAVKSQLGDFKLDLYNLMALRSDYLFAVRMERRAKAAEISKEIASLEAERKALLNIVADSTAPAQLEKVKELQQQQDSVYKALAEGKEQIKVYNKQLEKARSENEKMRGYIDTIKSSLGESITAADQKDIERYEAAITRNEQIITQIEAAIAKYNDLTGQYKEVKKAKESLYETLKTTVAPDALKRLDEIDQSIAMLEAQDAKNNAAEQRQNSYESKMMELTGKINSLAAKFSADSLINNLDAQADAFFNKLVYDDIDTKRGYEEGVKSYFLGSNEAASPTSVARIVKARKKEFYESYKNMVEVLVESYKMTAQSSEVSEGCLNASIGMADGVFGAKGMRVCNDLQKARAALQYTELLLAQYRFNAASDLQAWTDRYKMNDYDHDVTELDMDVYVLGNVSMKGLLKEAKKKAKEAAENAKSKITETVNEL